MSRDGSSFADVEVNRLLQEHGYLVYVVLSDWRLRCACYDQATSSPCPTCLYCFGAGFQVSVVKSRTYSRSQTPPSWGYFGAHPVESPGTIEVGGRYYYFANQSIAAASLSPGDMILEPQHDDGGRLTGIERAYRVSVVDPYRLYGVKVYRRAACSLLSSDIDSLWNALAYHLGGRAS